MLYITDVTFTYYYTNLKGRSKKGIQASTPSQSTMEIALINPHAARIDIVSKFHLAAVGQSYEEFIETITETMPFDYQISETEKSRQPNNLFKKFQRSISEYQFSINELTFVD